MRRPQFFKYLFVMGLLLLNRRIKGDDSSTEDEKVALDALKAILSNPFLTKNWTGVQCNMNNPETTYYGIQCVKGRVTSIILESMGLTGKVNAHAFVNLTELSILSFKNNSISGNVMDFSSNPKLVRIDLSCNRLSGWIPRSLQSLKLLESLQLQGNNLSGPIPKFHQQTLLKEFNVSNNNLSGRIPRTGVVESFNSCSYIGNPELCGPPSPNPCDAYKDDVAGSVKGSSNKHLTAIFIIFDVIGLIIVLVLLILYYKKAMKLKSAMKDKEIIEDKIDETSSIEEEEMKLGGWGGGEGKGKLVFMEGPGRFELSDLMKASAEGLGEGNFGNSYKVRLDDGSAAVVKRLRDLKPLSSEEFTKHLRLIAHQKHQNLLPLLAYYYSKDEKLVVYKHAHNGNLFNRIHHGRRGKDRIPFRWSSRLSVARGVARALEFLHLSNKSETTVVPHGNLKSSNVLLDENDMALVSDYGFTSIIALPIAAQRMVSYKSPEYHTIRKVSTKSDVWSYGCLLLELLTGRMSAHSAPPGINGVDLCSWVHRAVREEWTAEIFDLEASSQRGAVHGMLNVLQIAMRCCDKTPEKRPEMGQVVREVENIKVIDSEDEDDFSVDPSRTDDSLITTVSVFNGEEDQN